MTITVEVERKKSEELYQQISQVTPGGVNSPVRAFPGLDQTPMIVESGAGDLLTDIDGIKYIDYCCSWGALIHGHAHPQIVEAVEKRLRKGSSFGITTSVEEKLARKIVERVASVEKIRFVSSGTEATMSAARLARGYTGRDLIVKFSGNYHGHADFFLVQAGSGVTNLSPTSSSAGVPPEMVKSTVSLTYNDCEGVTDFLRNNADRVAAVIFEPVAGNMGVVPATADFMHTLRKETKKIGALLIFDEVISGFRLSIQEEFSIAPDLTTFGKVIGGGFPLAAFGGRAEIMSYLAPEGSVYQAGTLSGNPVAVEAGYQALLLQEREDFFEELEAKTHLITRPLSRYIEEKGIEACVQQKGSLFTLFFGVKKVSSHEDVKGCNLELFAEFFRYLFERGIYIPPSQHEAWFISAAHTLEHLERTRDEIIAFFEQKGF